MSDNAKDSKILSDKELVKLNQDQLGLDNCALKLSLEEKQLEILKLRSQVLSEQTERQRFIIGGARKAEGSQRAVKKAFVDLMTVKHNLTKGWGYDPIAGNIVESET